MRAHNFIDLTGGKFGRLTVKCLAERRNNRTYWMCECECGVVKEVLASSLSSGSTASCGCRSREVTSKVKKIHGASGYKKTPEYIIWAAIKRRCTNPNFQKYDYYGGRGITMCDEWLNDFTAFYRDMGMRPSVKHSIDRIDVNGNYEHSNCRWVTREEQSRNVRLSKRNTSGHRGVSKNGRNWQAAISIQKKTIYLGTFYTIEEAIEARLKAEEKYWGKSS